MNKLDHRLLRYFVAVAEELHFGRAAQKLHIAQPPLSQRIAELEEGLGLKLFERTKRKVTLTDAGQQLLKDGHKILDSLIAAEAHARAAAAGQKGLLRIGLNYSAPLHPAPSVLFQSFIKHYPHVELDLLQDDSAGQLNGLLQHKIDIGFIFAQQNVPAGISLHPLDRDEIQLVIPRHHDFAHQTRLAVKDFRGIALFLAPWQTQTTFYRALTLACHKYGFEPNARTHISQMPFIMNLVAAGRGITFVPTFLERIRPAGTLFHSCSFLPAAARRMPLSMAFRTHDALPLVKNFIASAKIKL